MRKIGILLLASVALAQQHVQRVWKWESSMGFMVGATSSGEQIQGVVAINGVRYAEFPLTQPEFDKSGWVFLLVVPPKKGAGAYWVQVDGRKVGAFVGQFETKEGPWILMLPPGDYSKKTILLEYEAGKIKKQK